MVIALFYAVGTALGGTAGLVAVRLPDRHRLARLPVLRRPGRRGAAAGDGGRGRGFFGVKAERTSLEEIAAPLSAADDAEAAA